jgi:hypothetical protein
MKACVIQPPYSLDLSYSDEYFAKKRYFKSNYYRQQGNVLMERVVNLKQIMECGGE